MRKFNIKFIKFALFVTCAFASENIDNCVDCHKDYGSIDKFHSVDKFGCYSCHLGNKFAKTKDEAHKNLLLNPSRLEHAQILCSSCHEEIIKRVVLSPMKSQIGIKKVLKEQWVEKSVSNLAKSELKELADSHYTKACASCHINQKREVFHDKNLAKGGGCSACHKDVKPPNKHTKFTTKIPSSNCIKCHNRSNRIGLSYFGKFESEGYGTPYVDGNFSNQIDKNRFFYQLPPDIHHQKAKLDCIDCHTHKGVMGDAKGHLHMEEAVDIRCEDCHQPNFKKADKTAKRLIKLNENIPNSKLIAYSKRKNAQIYNLQKQAQSINFYRKKDGKKFAFKPMSQNSYHTNELHKRLDCSACHSSWIPSCYGCHEVYFEKGKQFDWVKHKVTKGSWQEFRSFLRFEKPALGIGYNQKIMPYAPGCQVLATAFKDGKIKKFHSMAMAGWSPHTSSRSRDCVDCHFSSNTLGLGAGNLDFKDGSIHYQPYYNSAKNNLPFSYPIDAFIDLNATQFQTTSREYARAFNKKELDKIINAYKCIICHRSWDDKIYKDFNASKLKFSQGLSKCLD